MTKTEEFKEELDELWKSVNNFAHKWKGVSTYDKNHGVYTLYYCGSLPKEENDV